MDGVKLQDIIGKPISGEWGNDDLTGKGVPVLRTTNFTNEGVINYDNVVTRDIPIKKIAGKYLTQGDILLEKSGGSDKQPVGRVVYFDGEENKYVFNNFTAALRIKDKNVWNSRYLFYALFANYLKGGTVKYENKTTGLHNLKVDLFIRNFTIKKIPIELQEALASKLDLVSRLIDLRKHQMNDFDELIKSRFVELFGSPNNNIHNFPIVRLNDVAIGPLSYGSSSAAVEFNGQTRYIRITDILSNGQLGKDIKSAAESGDKYLLKDGDILFARTGATVGKTFKYSKNYGRSIYAGFLIRLRPNQAIINPDYLYYFTKSDYYQNFVISTQRTVAQPNINAKEYGNLRLLLPNIDLQNQFAHFVQQLDKSKLAVQKSLDELEILKKSLMQQYFG